MDIHIELMQLLLIMNFTAISPEAIPFHKSLLLIMHCILDQMEPQVNTCLMSMHEWWSSMSIAHRVSWHSCELQCRCSYSYQCHRAYLMVA